MSSQFRLFAGLCVSAALLLGGGWLASQAKALEPEHRGPATPLTALDPIDETRPEGLTVTIDNVRSNEGRVIVLVFDQAQAFSAYDVEAAVGYGEHTAVAGKVQFAFDDLTSGPYAVFAFHDADGDYDLAMDGDYPLEGYGGTSMDTWHAQPSFTQAAIAARETGIALHYLD